MYNVQSDSRITMYRLAPSGDGGRWTPAGVERVFSDKAELVRYLAAHTFTGRYADSIRWKNGILNRQSLSDADAGLRRLDYRCDFYCPGCWTTVEAIADIRFCDAWGRTLDIRAF